jgi:DNA-binding response OmpR family regulator
MTSAQQPLLSGPPLRLGRLSIDRERFLATVDEAPVELTYLEFSVLVLIVEQGGRVATYDALALALWGDTSATTRRRLAVLISRVRSKLGPAGDYIETVQRVGYRMGRLVAGDVGS